MMRFTMILFVWFALLSFSGTAFGEVVFSEDFSTNLNAWTLLDTPGTSGTVDVGLSNGKLSISMTNNDQWRTQGVQSAEQYVLPVGGKLIVDFYGINEGSSHSYPYWAVCANPNTSGFFNRLDTGWFAVKGWDAYWGDWVQWNGIPGGYVSLPVTKATTSKHVIIEIDASYINVYIEDDYYRNLTSPTAVYTVATSSVFNTEKLSQQGLYVCVLAARYTEWYTGEVNEKFDGVEVSYIEHTPVDCNEAMLMGYEIKGDVNRDCRVDMLDLMEMVQAWLDQATP